MEIKDIQHAKKETCGGCAFCRVIPPDFSENLDAAICARRESNTKWVCLATRACQAYEPISSTIDVEPDYANRV